MRSCWPRRYLPSSGAPASRGLAVPLRRCAGRVLRCRAKRTGFCPAHGRSAMEHRVMGGIAMKNRSVLPVIALFGMILLIGLVALVVLIPSSLVFAQEITPT